MLFTLPSEVPDSVPPTSYPPLSFPPHFHACSAPPSCLIVCFCYYVASLMPLIWIPWPAPLKLTSASESHQYACPTRAEALVSLSGAGILVAFLFACHTITVEKKKPELCSREIKKVPQASTSIISVLSNDFSNSGFAQVDLAGGHTKFM